MAKINPRVEVLDIMNFDAEEREVYEGYQEGKAIGIHLGLQEGQRQIVQNMFQQGYSLEQVMQMTGLSETDIKNLELRETLAIQADIH
jgi:predicted transposase/invertase (TIGR01784 family)